MELIFKETCEVKREYTIDIDAQDFIEWLDGVVTVSDEQMRNTFYHELFHAFQFYFNNEFNEAQAQVYANFMCEFIETTEEPF